MRPSLFQQKLSEKAWTASLGSTSAVKRAALAPYIKELYCYEVDPQVPAQPTGDAQTRQGAIARSRGAFMRSLENQDPSAFGVGLEGGVAFEKGRCYLVNWGALYAPEMDGVIESCGPRLELPQAFISPLTEGKELREILATFKKEIDESLQPLCSSAMALFSYGAFTREEMFQVITRSLLGQYFLHQSKSKLF